MKYVKSISILTFIIIALSLFASTYGIFSSGGQAGNEFRSVHDKVVQLHGKGLYRNDSISIASQGISQDIVTVIMGIPLLILSLNLFRKRLLKGKLLLAGTLGYFLYTYISYTFLWMYNSLFLIYVILMSSSLFAFILTLMSFDVSNLKNCFNEKMPIKFISGTLFFLAAILGIMWLGMIISPLINNTIPLQLEHYTTLVIQAMDLAFVVPTAILAGVLLIKRSSFGYLLSSVMIIKALSMGIAILAMIIGQLIAGVNVSLTVISIFVIVNVLVLYCVALIMNNVNELEYFKNVNKK